MKRINGKKEKSTFTALTDAEVKDALKRFPDAIINDFVTMTGEPIFRFREGEKFLKTLDPKDYKIAARRVPEFESDPEVKNIEFWCKAYIKAMERVRSKDPTIDGDTYFLKVLEITMERFYGNIPEKLTSEDMSQVERMCKGILNAMGQVIKSSSNPGRGKIRVHPKKDFIYHSTLKDIQEIFKREKKDTRQALMKYIEEKNPVYKPKDNNDDSYETVKNKFVDKLLYEKNGKRRKPSEVAWLITGAILGRSVRTLKKSR